MGGLWEAGECKAAVAVARGRPGPARLTETLREMFVIEMESAILRNRK